MSVDDKVQFLIGVMRQNQSYPVVSSGPVSLGYSWTCANRIDAILLADMLLETIDLFGLNSSTFHMRFDSLNGRTLIFEPVADGDRT